MQRDVNVATHGTQAVGHCHSPRRRLPSTAAASGAAAAAAAAVAAAAVAAAAAADICEAACIGIATIIAAAASLSWIQLIRVGRGAWGVTRAPGPRQNRRPGGPRAPQAPRASPRRHLFCPGLIRGLCWHARDSHSSASLVRAYTIACLRAAPRAALAHIRASAHTRGHRHAMLHATTCGRICAYTR